MPEMKRHKLRETIRRITAKPRPPTVTGNRVLAGGGIASGSSPTLVQLVGNDWFRRVSPVAPRPREGPLTEPIAGAQPPPHERVLMSSRPEDSHLRTLPDPYVNLSIHTAPDVRPFPWQSGRSGFASSPGSSRRRLARGRG